MTKDELLMKHWEEMYDNGEPLFSAFSTHDILELQKRFHDLVIYKALKRFDYNLGNTARFLGFKSSQPVTNVADKYIPNHKELRHAIIMKKRLERRRQRYQDLKQAS